MANVSSNNLTTLYSGGGVNVRPTSAYGNANVVALLNVGTDGGNTVTNIVATGNLTIGNITANGNVTADYFIGNLIGNISGNATNANYANYAGEAFNVSGSNVTGYVANATHSNVADVANSVSVANVVGIGNIAVLNLDGNVSNILHGNGYWGPESGNLNANYANFAGNVTNSAQPNITSVGTLTGLTSNGTVNFANAANVNLGSNTNVHISGGAANYALITDGAGNLSWGQVANAANANYANFAGQVVDATQSNITQTGNLVSWTVNDGVANTATTQFYPNANINIPTAYSGFGPANAVGLTTFYTDPTFTIANTTIATTIVDIGSDGETANATNTIYVKGSVSNTTAFLGSQFWQSYGNIGNGGTDPIVAGYYQISTFNPGSNLADPNNQGTGTSYNIGQGGIGVSVGSPATGLLSLNGYGQPSYGGDPIGSNAIANAIQITRTRGNGDVRLSVEPNDYIGNIAWRGRRPGSPAGGRLASIGAKVASYYVANTAAVPLDIELTTVDNTSLHTSTFWSNGDATFGNVVNANFFVGDGGLLSNITIAAGSQIINGNTNVTALANGNVTFDIAGVSNVIVVSNNGAIVNGTMTANFFSGDGSNLSSITGANVTGTVANANYAAYSGNSLILANGTSNISIPTASSNILISTAGNANIVDIWAQGTLNLKPPAQGPQNALRIDTYGRSGNQGAQRISSFRYRGNATTPLSVQPSDNTMEILTIAYNGTALQTNSVGIIRATVDSSYTANGANIPLGWQVIVNDTNGGVNNQSKVHNFYSNGTVNFANSISVSGNGNISSTNIQASSQITANGTITGNTLNIGNIVANGGFYNFGNASSGATVMFFAGDKTTNSSFSIDNAQFSVTMSNVDTTTGFSPFRFQQYAPNNQRFGSMYYYRSRGDDYFTSAPVVAGDQVMSYNFLVNSNNVTTSIGSFNSTVSYNDNAGNVGTQLDFNAIGSGTTGYLNGVINLYANTTNANNFTATSINITGNGNIGNLQLNQYQEDVFAIGSTSGTITPDFVNGSIQTMTLTGSITMNSLANAVAGRSMVLVITQGGTGSYTLTSSMKFAGAYKTLSTSVGATDIISVFYDGTTYYASLSSGYA